MAAAYRRAAFVEMAVTQSLSCWRGTVSSSLTCTFVQAEAASVFTAAVIWVAATVYTARR